MKRRDAILAAGAVVVLYAGCGGQLDNRYHGAKVGDACVPAVEDDAAFLGFGASQVNIELPAADADPGVLVCLVDHFRGRVTCPYGQAADASELPAVDGASGGPFVGGAGPCKTPEGEAVVGDASDPTAGAQVEPQCGDRRAASVVTWSCRCQNAAGRTDDGASYCSCPDGTQCVQLVAAVGPPPAGQSDVAGAYCIRAGTQYDAAAACASACDPVGGRCL